MTEQAGQSLEPEINLPADDGCGDSGEIDRGTYAPRHLFVDLLSLHAQMDYTARSLWDVQKCRIMVSNRATQFTAANLDALLSSLESEERKLKRALESLAKEHPLGDWIQGTHGIGLPSIAGLMGLTGPLDRFANPAKLWKFVGMAVVDGHAPVRQRGVPWTHTDCKGGHLQKCTPTCKTDHHKNCRPGVMGTAYSPQARVICFQIAESFVKNGGPYRELYDQRKATVQARDLVGPSECPFGKHHHERETGKTVKCSKGHVHADAMRYAVKRLLRDMWVEWRRTVSEAPELPVPLYPQQPPQQIQEAA